METNPGATLPLLVLPIWLFCEQRGSESEFRFLGTLCRSKNGQAGSGCLCGTVKGSLYLGLFARLRLFVACNILQASPKLGATSHLRWIPQKTSCTRCTYRSMLEQWCLPCGWPPPGGLLTGLLRRSALAHRSGPSLGSQLV